MKRHGRPGFENFMILITGGLGYLGGRLAKYLSDRGCEVRVATSKSNANLPVALEACQLVHIDFQDVESLKQACKGVTAVFHLSSPNAQDSAAKPQNALIVNGIGTLNLLSACLSMKVKSIVYFSTVHVYGSPLKGLISEDTLPRPTHPYSITHRLAEDYILQADASGKISGAILRLSNAVGAPIEKRANCWMLVVNDLCRQCATDKRMRVRSDKAIQRDYLPISSICEFAMNVLEGIGDSGKGIRGQIFNVCAGKSITLEDLTHKIADRSEILFGYRPEIYWGEPGTRFDSDHLEILAKKAEEYGLLSGQDLSQEIDNLLLLSENWFSKGKEK